MIIEALLNIIMTLLQVVFGWINIPGFPTELTNSISSFLSLIFDNLTLLGFFIRPATITVVIPILIILLNFEHVYSINLNILECKVLCKM